MHFAVCFINYVLHKEVFLSLCPELIVRKFLGNTLCSGFIAYSGWRLPPGVHPTLPHACTFFRDNYQWLAKLSLRKACGCYWSSDWEDIFYLISLFPLTLCSHPSEPMIECSNKTTLPSDLSCKQGQLKVNILHSYSNILGFAFNPQVGTLNPSWICLFKLLPPHP